MKLKLRENADINVVTGISDILIDSINKKWDNIRDLNSIIVNLNEEGYEDMVPVIESILEDENKNVGKLQQLVELISPTASSIDDGRQEAIDELDNIEEIKVEEMKLNETFENVPDYNATKDIDADLNADASFINANEEHDSNKEKFEDALKENEKLAKETIPKDGYTGKKVTSKSLKAMHLSESLFDEDLDFEDHDKFVRQLYHAVEPVVKGWADTESYFKNGFSSIDVETALEEVAQHLLDDIEFKDDSENFNLGEEVKLTEAADSPKNKKEIFRKKLDSLISDIAKEHNMNIGKWDREEFLKFALKMVPKLSAHYNMDDKEIKILTDRLFRQSFNMDGKYIRYLEEELPADNKNNNSVKLDIAREQIKRFKEGKMPKDWTPDNYVNDMIKKNHLTKEEGEQLLSEDYGDMQDISDFRQQIEVDMMNLKRAYHELSNTEEDNLRSGMELVNYTIQDLDRLLDNMEIYLYDNFN